MLECLAPDVVTIFIHYVYLFAKLWPQHPKFVLGLLDNFLPNLVVYLVLVSRVLEVIRVYTVSVNVGDPSNR